MINIEFEFIDIEIPDFRPEFFRLWLSEVAKAEDRQIGRLTYIFCSDDYLHRLNIQFLKHDELTDVLTFGYNDKDSLKGDCFISYERVLDNAVHYSGGDTFDELCRVMVHGLLHLSGYNDKSNMEVERMRNLEAKYLVLRDVSRETS